MGSGSTRKITDSPIIRIPKVSQKSKGGVGGGGGGRQGSTPEEVASVCVSSFETKLTKNHLLKDGLPVFLKKNGSGVYDILLFNKNVGSLNIKISGMVERCTEMGVLYTGEIKQKKDEFYARFIRK